MAVPWAKVAGNIHYNHKIRRAGNLARQVFFLALCENAMGSRDGYVSAAAFDDEKWLSDTLLVTSDEARYGVTAAVTHKLLRKVGEKYEIVGWGEEWMRGSSTGAERQAKYRANRKSDKANVTGDASDTEEKRREEKRRSNGRKRPSVPLPDSWSPNDAAVQKARDLGIDLTSEVERFRNYAQQKDWRNVDWDATFRNWITSDKRKPNTSAQTSLPVSRKL